MRSHYTINEIFCAPQGEGVRAGTMNVFVRFTGCNLQCRMEPGPLSPGGFDCDTEFVSGRKMTPEEILGEAGEFGVKAVIFSGGEPSLQLDGDLVSRFRTAGFHTAIETNGTLDVSSLGLDWISCSPKVAEHAVRLQYANELRYVRAYGQGIPRPSCKASHHLISPAFDGLDLQKKNLDWCIKLCKENPEWRLSVQMHKVWAVR